MTFQQWGGTLADAFQNLWVGVVKFAPQIIIAILVALVGWLIAVLVGKAVAHVIKLLKVDQALRRAGVEDVVSKAGMQLNSGAFVGALVKWFVIVAFLVAALDIVNLTEVTRVLEQFVLVYIPQILVAVFVLVIAAVLSDVVGKAIRSSVKAAEFPHAALMAHIAKWVIWITAILIALSELNIATPFINTLFTGFIAAVSIALGLSFGLGGRDAAKQFIEKTRDEVSHTR